MSEKAATNAVDGYVKLVLTVVLTVAGSWATVSKEIHGYIDTKMEDVSQQMVRTISAQATGQMLQVMDSTKQAIQSHQDTMYTRLERIETRIGMRNTNGRTVVVTPDTAALAEVQRRLFLIEQGIEAILDGPPASKVRAKRAHNAQPQD